MILIKEIIYQQIDGDKEDHINYTRTRLQEVGLEKRHPLHEEIIHKIEEITQCEYARSQQLPNGKVEEVYYSIGLSKQACEFLEIPLCAFEKQKTQIDEQQKMIKAMTLTIAQMRSNIAEEMSRADFYQNSLDQLNQKIENATFWERLKFLFKLCY